MTYTALATPEAESRVARDLDRIVAAVREAAAADPLRAVFLIGGYARSEGTVVRDGEGRLRGFNDYDLLLVFAAGPRDPARYGRLAASLAVDLGIDFVDLGIATVPGLALAPPTLFWYEAGEAHRVLWRAPGGDVALPRFRVQDLDPAEGSRLLVNRGMSLLWAARRLWRDRSLGDPPAVGDAGHVRFSLIACHKAVAAAGDAALLRHGAYDVSQDVRVDRLTRRPELTAWAEPGFVEAYRSAAAFRREPVLDPAAAAGLWAGSRRHHEAGFRAAETARLGAGFGDWADHSRRCASHARRERLRRPRRLLAWARGGVPGEEIRFRTLPGLLYHAAPESGDWTEAVDRLIGEWHD